MIHTNHDSRHPAKRSNGQSAVVLTVLCALLCSCNTVALAPLDDAYYWPEKTTSTTKATQTEQSAPSTQSAAEPQKLDYINVQDTTVTIRIKR